MLFPEIVKTGAGRIWAKIMFICNVSWPSSWRYGVGIRWMNLESKRDLNLTYEFGSHQHIVDL